MRKEVQDKRGIALIMALWIMTILLTVAASFTFMMRMELRLASNSYYAAQARYLASAGIDAAIAKLRADKVDSSPNYIKTDSLHEAWFTHFSENFHYTTNYDEMRWDEKWFPFGEGGYQVRLIDEAGMHNINAMEGGILHPTSLVGLTDLLEEGPGQHVAAEKKACRFRDYRDPDIDPIISTSWDSSDCKNHSYDTLREIQKVKDINVDTDYPLDGVGNNPLADHANELTVYSEDPDKTLGSTARVNINTAAKADILAVLTAAGVTCPSSPDSYGYYWRPSSRDESAQAIVDYILFQTVGQLIEPKCLPWSYKYKMVGDPPVETPGTLTDANLRERDKNMKRVADWFTVAPTTANEIYYKPTTNPNRILGPININTAPKWALCSLFGISEEKAKSIIKIRHYPDYAGATLSDRAEGATLHDNFTFGREDTTHHGRGEIMLVGGAEGVAIAGGIFKDCSDQITVRSDRFRIVSTGKVMRGTETLAERKIEATVDRHYHEDGTMGPITVLYWSEAVLEYD